MSKNDSTYQLIEDYLNESLTLDQVSDVENRMLIDSNFKNYVEQHRLANQMILLSEENNIKTELAAIHTKAVYRKKILNLSLIVLTTIAILWLIAHFLSKENKEELVAQQIEVISAPLTDSKREVEKTDLKEQESNVSNLPIQNEEDLISESEDINYTENNKPSVSTKEATKTDQPLMIVKNKEASEEDKLDKEKTEILKKALIPNKEPRKADVCDSYEAQLGINTIPTCTSKIEGQLFITSEKNDYYYSLTGGITKQKEVVFTKLKAGSYNLIAIDKSNCKSDPISFEIEAEECDFMIQPDQQIFWKIPVSKFGDETIELEIYDARSGQKIYARILDEFSETTWNGESLNGSPLPMGNYMYVLISKNKKQTGSITIVR